MAKGGRRWLTRRSSSPFLTQQVGGAHNGGIDRLLGSSSGADQRWTLQFAVEQLAVEGFCIADRREAFPPTTFRDPGVLVH